MDSKFSSALQYRDVAVASDERSGRRAVRIEICRSGRAWTYYACLLTSLAVGGSLGAPTAHAAVGRTPGTFQVSQTGSATYSIPIWVPPGPKGMQPDIALMYNSRSGIGPLGVGWGIGGLSSIYRCQRTYAQDGTPAPVTLTVSDAFCIDGMRLQLTSGTYGEAGSTYQTEIADFSNVTAYGAAGNGPAYFIVQAADGHSYTYGNGGSSQLLASGTSTALSWQLNEVSDRVGNTMSIAYSASDATGSVVPSSISWTPSAYQSSTYNYTMNFAYGANVAQSSHVERLQWPEHPSRTRTSWRPSLLIRQARPSESMCCRISCRPPHRVKSSPKSRSARTRAPRTAWRRPPSVTKMVSRASRQPHPL